MRAHRLGKILVVLLLAINCGFFNNACSQSVLMKIHVFVPLTQDLPVHSTSVVTTIRVVVALAQLKQVRVLTLNTPPLGTSGVRVVVTIEI
jgi:hypothetical protein